MTKVFPQGAPPKIAFIGTYIPRQCGIATFTSDLAHSLSMHQANDPLIIAVSDTCGKYSYPDEVLFEVDQHDKNSYRACAKFLEASGVDILCVQHEYGIFGGAAGNNLFELLDNIQIPVVTTLHTILESPTDEQRASMDRLAHRSSKLVVMSERGVEMLRRVHGVPTSKIEHIHHGVPAVKPGSGSKWRNELGLGDRKVLLTFGLLSPDKGIENVIEAMPAIVRDCPDAAYVVVGATHPHIRSQNGEVYRERLEQLVRDLGMEDHVIFHNRFVSLCELTAFLDMADIYVTPYLKKEQITSGTLAYALGSGRAIISTPYWYAEELLGDGRGVLVPWRCPEAIAEAASALLADDDYRGEVRKRATSLGSKMRWPAVAAEYANVIDEAAGRSRPVSVTRISSPLPFGTLGPVTPSAKPTPARPGLRLPLTHLMTLTDDVGLIQHAIGTVPNYAEGYCVDDNGRALLLTSQLRRSELQHDDDVLDRLEAKYLAFLFYAFNSEKGRFRNFMTFDRRWVEEAGSEDSHARAIWGLAAMARSRPIAARAVKAEELLFAALPAVRDFTSPRAWAYTLLGIDEAIRTNLDNPFLEDLGEELADRLQKCYSESASESWPWFEPYLSYDNARLPEALMATAQWLEDGEMLETALLSLAWLSRMQTSKEGLFEPVGCSSVMQRGDKKPQFDQQPIEAYAAASSSLRAWRITRNPKWLQDAHIAASWFHGKNPHGASMFDPHTGACADGLSENGVNQNSGAESTLAGLLTVVEMAAELTPIGRNAIVNPAQEIKV